MEKKVWNKPELTILGIEKTEFDDSYTVNSANCKKPPKSQTIKNTYPKSSNNILGYALTISIFVMEKCYGEMIWNLIMKKQNNIIIKSMD